MLKHICVKPKRVQALDQAAGKTKKHSGHSGKHLSQRAGFFIGTGMILFCYLIANFHQIIINCWNDKNTAENCCLEQQDYPARIYLVFLNSGNLYPLDIFQANENPDNIKNQNITEFTRGYDEFSESSIQILNTPGLKSETVTIYCGSPVIEDSLMENFFCDNCMRGILNTVKNNPVKEILIYDMEDKFFYPIEEGTLQIGNYFLRTEYNEETYKIKIKYMNL